MLLTKNITIKWTNRNKYWYISKGYILDENNKEIIVDTMDLTVGSHRNVKVECDYCKKELEMKFKDFLKQRNKTPFKEDVCINCGHNKARKNNNLKYGVDNVMQVPEFKENLAKVFEDRYGVRYYSQTDEHKEKYTATCLEKYGVSHYSQTDEFKVKSKNTMLEKYGVEYYTQTEESKNRFKETCLRKYGFTNPTQNPEVANKVKATNIERYGYENVFQNEEIKEKIRASNLEKYGVEYYSQTKEFKDKYAEHWRHIKETGLIEDITNKRYETNIKKYGTPHPLQNAKVLSKVMNTLYMNNNAPTSQQQLHIHNLIGGKLNYPFGRSFLDIAYPEELIYLEYDGGGHNLQVKRGDITQEQFDKKEQRRSFFLKDNGWKEIRIISDDDKLPNDTDIMDFVKSAKSFFNAGKGFSVKWNADEDNKVLLNYKHTYGIKEFNEVYGVKEAI